MTVEEKDKILNALRFLEMLVVSLDRIGSYSTRSGTDDPNLLSNFIDEFDVFQAAAHSRDELSHFFNDEIPEGKDVSEMEMLLQDVKAWNPPSVIN